MGRPGSVRTGPFFGGGDFPTMSVDDDEEDGAPPLPTAPLPAPALHVGQRVADGGGHRREVQPVRDVADGEDVRQVGRVVVVGVVQVAPAEAAGVAVAGVELWMIPVETRELAIEVVQAPDME